MFGPIFSLLVIAAILLASAFSIAWRFSRWKFDRVHQSYFGYLSLALLVGTFFAYLPTMVLNRGMAFWLDDAQPNTFYGFIIWFVLSVAFMFFAPKRYLLVPIFSVFAVIADFILFLFMGEAGDLETLFLTFVVMRCTGIGLVVLAAISFWLIAREKAAKT